MRKIDVDDSREREQKTERTDWLALAIATEPFLERHGVLCVRRTVELVTYTLWDATVVLCGNGNDCGEDGVCVHPCLDSRRLVIHLEALNIAAGHACAASKLIPVREKALELGRNLLAIRDLARAAKFGVMRTPFMCWILNRAYISLFVRLMFLSEEITGSKLLFRLARPYAESQEELLEHDKFSKFGCRVSNVEAGWRRITESRQRIIGHRFCSPLGITQRLTHPGAERLSKAECLAVSRKLENFAQAERAQMREEPVQAALLEVAGVLATHLTAEEVRLNARLLGQDGTFEPACARLVGKAERIVNGVLHVLEEGV